MAKLSRFHIFEHFENTLSIVELNITEDEWIRLYLDNDLGQEVLNYYVNLRLPIRLTITL